ncbi:MAG TPA: trigger factor [bacterium]|nr:trigger factor [bacterium]
MKVEVRREPQSRAVLEVELPSEDLARGVERAVKRLNQRVDVPGFRRGKAPRGLLERVVGKDAIYDEAVRLLVADAYEQAVDEAGVTPIAQPRIDVETVEEGRPLRFTATVDLVPEVHLGDYSTIRIPFEEPEVTEGDLDQAVEDLRSRHAHLVSVPGRAAAEGDYVLVRAVDVAGSPDRFAAGKEYLMEIGGGTFPPEVETAVTGGGVGDRRTAALGDKATVTLEVVDIKQRELPPLNDEFAKAAANVPSLETLRGTLKDRAMTDAAARAAREYEQKVVDALLEPATVELPESLVKHEVEHMLADLTETLQRRALTLPRYLDATGKTDDQLREEFRPTAERRLRTQLALDEVARRAGLQPSEEEIDREVENVARRLHQDVPRVREWLADGGRYENLLAVMRREKALTHLVTLARSLPHESSER